ncbi:hypothetical protein BGC31_13870 [Komagataeibacter xylinus]|nr:hypothetical protein BGC31_13870 [Komagataeibacter xylinus]RFP07618.1 hypothetical protein BFX83_14160 [Komagataeibacter xylinus]
MQRGIGGLVRATVPRAVILVMERGPQWQAIAGRHVTENHDMRIDAVADRHARQRLGRPRRMDLRRVVEAIP